RVARPTPLGLPLVIERIGGRLSSQSLADRVEQMKAAWEKDLANLGKNTDASRSPQTTRAKKTRRAASRPHATHPSSPAESQSS
ncbi:MAG: hypothetical protein JNL50_04965, partial [Phycisphaerae bacterium]|nr:hypothetical protein [Phycisphaerae bacterium]